MFAQRPVEALFVDMFVLLKLLDQLPPDEVNRLVSLAEIISLAPLDQLHEQDGPLPFVYFPKSGVLSSVIARATRVEWATMRDRTIVQPLLARLGDQARSVAEQVLGPARGPDWR